MSATRLARLLEVLRTGEELAAHVALRQSHIAPAPWMSRALCMQAAQERSHAAMATAALTRVATKQRAPDVTIALRRRINHDLDAGNLAASILGLQGVIEHLGEAMLEMLGRHQHPAGVLLHALRKKVLAQERGHVLLGARCLQALGATPAENRNHDALAALDEYRAIGRATALQVAALLDDARLDAGAFWTDVDARLSAWHEHAHAQHPH